MRFLLDENVRSRLAAHLRQFGHDVTTAVDDYPPQAPDTLVLARAHQERRVVITRDGDFERLVFQEGRPHVGVIYLQLHNPSLRTIIERVDAALAAYPADSHSPPFIVASGDQIEVRSGGRS